MSTATLWILIFTANFYRPAAVIERFSTEAQCAAAAKTMDAMSDKRGGPDNQWPVCLRVEAAR